jgi:Rhs element Vgr protein
VKVEGQALPREHHLLGAYITKAVNRISSARLLYLDGSASSSDFPLSNTDFFVPGKQIEILAGPADQPVSLFKGIVVRIGLKVRDHSASELIVDCRHQAVKLTVGRKARTFQKITDGDIISELLSNVGLAGNVESTTVTHEHQYQHNATDWDFLLSRADANGKLVFTNGDKVDVKKPVFSGSPVCTLKFGATILEFDGEIDSRTQFAAVKSITWDPAQQSVLQKDAADPAVSGPGNFSTSKLAGVVGLQEYDLLHVSISDAEAQAWADAQWLKSQMSRSGGRIKCEGIGTVNPGDIVTLDGVGDRFKGNVFVSGVRQDFDLVHGWKTHIQFGNTDKWFVAEADVSAPKAGALVPAASGLQIGIVTSNEDPKGEHRVRVRLPLVTKDQDGIWARVASIDAGSDRGFFIRPEIKDEVVVGFLDDDPGKPVILGMLNSSAKAAPLKGSDDNNEKVYQSRSKMKLYFNDDTKVLKLETPAGNRVTLSEDEKTLKLEDQNGNKIEMTQDGITIQSSKALALKAKTEANLESGTAFSAKGGTELKLQGTSSAELSSSATTKIKGGLVQLN